MKLHKSALYIGRMLWRCHCFSKPIFHDGVNCCKIFLPTGQSLFAPLLQTSRLLKSFPFLSVQVPSCSGSHCSHCSSLLSYFSTARWMGLLDTHIQSFQTHPIKRFWSCPLQPCKPSACLELNVLGKCFRQARAVSDEKESQQNNLYIMFSSFE